MYNKVCLLAGEHTKQKYQIMKLYVNVCTYMINFIYNLPGLQKEYK